MPELLRLRRLIALLTVLILLALDGGRSLVGHFGYQMPASIWHPDPKVYADMAWPPSANVPANASRAQGVYLEKCAFCHGPDGRGNGTSAPSMIPRPRDFTQGQFKYKSTPASAPPSDDDLVKVVSDGLHASGMPYFRGILSDADIRAVVSYVKGFANVFAAPAPTPIAVPQRVPPTADSVARGAALYVGSGCVACHGADLRGGQWMVDDKDYPVISRDLTAPWTFRGGDNPQDVFLRLSTGLAPAPMPAFAELPPESRWDLVNFLESKRRIPPWYPGGKLAGPGQSPDLKTRGRYLVHAEMCGLCHTELDRAMVYRGDDRYLAGGMRVGAYPHGVFITRNLTSDPETGLGRWSDAEIARAIRDGRAKGGRLLNLWGMPWPWLHNLSPGDAIAIARYLKTLPPVHNAIPAPLHYGVVETIAAKLVNRNPLLGFPRLTYAVGSYANLPPTVASIAGALADAQWVVLFAGVVLFAVVSRRNLPRRAGGWAKLVALVAGAVFVFAAGAFLYQTPTVGVIPPERISAGATGSIPRPDVSRLSPERAALVRRGRYIFANASCAYCHGNDGAGGLKVGGPFGTIFTGNISSDRAAGLGAWSDAEIARAVRSGVTRDGRLLFWQGMPWDHFSNFDEEDVVALIAYLRVLPPIAEIVPPDQVPSPDACKVYTFWTYRDLEPGCR